MKFKRCRSRAAIDRPMELPGSLGPAPDIHLTENNKGAARTAGGTRLRETRSGKRGTPFAMSALL